MSKDLLGELSARRRIKGVRAVRAKMKMRRRRRMSVGGRFGAREGGILVGCI